MIDTALIRIHDSFGREHLTRLKWTEVEDPLNGDRKTVLGEPEIIGSPDVIRHILRLIAYTYRNPWIPIGQMPLDFPKDKLFIALTADGRIMQVTRFLLESMINPATPDHLRFPATHYMEVQKP